MLSPNTFAELTFPSKCLFFLSFLILIFLVSNYLTLLLISLLFNFLLKNWIYTNSSTNKVHANSTLGLPF